MKMKSIIDKIDWNQIISYTKCIVELMVEMGT
jgi:hypothetical protein